MLPELLEGFDNSPLPDAAVIPHGYEMTSHHTAKVLTSGLAIVREVVPRKPHPNCHVVTRHEEADVAEAVVNAGGEMILQLRLREDMVSVFPVKAGTQKEWMTSAPKRRMSTGCPVGI